MTLAQDTDPSLVFRTRPSWLVKSSTGQPVCSAAACSSSLSAASAASCTAGSAMRVVRLPATPESNGTASVSHTWTSTLPTPTPSTSAATCANIVYAPVPGSKIGVLTTTAASALSTTSA